MINKDSILQDLRNIGIENGDILFITADLLNVGYFNKSKSQTLNDWIEIFKEAVGSKGCFIVGAYSKTFFRFKKDKNIIFNRNAPTVVGALATYMINHKLAIRSSHPTHSCVGIGEDVNKYLENHTVYSSSYKVLENILNANGKFLMLGTIDKKNSPQALHLAQEKLGYTKYSPYKWLFQTYYRDNFDKIKLYTKKDFGGCSAGGYKLFGSLLINDAVKISKIGNANSALMNATESFNIIKDVLLVDKRRILCDNKLCTQCYGNFKYNGVNAIFFYIKKLFYILSGLKSINFKN